MTEKLAVYNGALAHLKVRQLASLTDMRTSRLALDRVWADGVRTCLASAAWKFAIRVEWLKLDTRLPEGGYAFAFRKPAGWLRTVVLATDEVFDTPLQCEDGPEFIFGDVSPLHAKWVAETDPSEWTGGFEAYVCAHLASLVVDELPSRGVTRAEFETLARELREDAMTSEAEAQKHERRIWRAGVPRGDGGSTVRL